MNNDKEKIRKDIIKDTLQKSLELCWEIEKLPASELQTKVSLMASEIYQQLRKLV